jgi:hypothetical protein
LTNVIFDPNDFQGAINLDKVIVDGEDWNKHFNITKNILDEPFTESCPDDGGEEGESN